MTFAQTAACVGGYVFSPRPGAPAGAARSSDCLLHVVHVWPYPGYFEIGLVEWNGAAGVPRTLDEFYDRVRPTACEAGAEVVIGQPNPDGKYTRGVLLVPYRAR